MPGWRTPDYPPRPEPYDPPPPPPHVVDPWQFPVPSARDLTSVLGNKELAYLASLALLRAGPEIRVLAALIVRLHDDRSNDEEEPPSRGRAGLGEGGAGDTDGY